MNVEPIRLWRHERQARFAPWVEKEPDPLVIGDYRCVLALPRAEYEALAARAANATARAEKAEARLRELEGKS